jgi:hypothetical protein
VLAGEPAGEAPPRAELELLEAPEQVWFEQVGHAEGDGF